MSEPSPPSNGMNGSAAFAGGGLFAGLTMAPPSPTKTQPEEKEDAVQQSSSSSDFVAHADEAAREESEPPTRNEAPVVTSAPLTDKLLAALAPPDVESPPRPPAPSAVWTSPKQSETKIAQTGSAEVPDHERKCKPEENLVAPAAAKSIESGDTEDSPGITPKLNGTGAEAPQTPAQRKPSVVQDAAVDDAFRVASPMESDRETNMKSKRPKQPTGLGAVSHSTPIPNSDVCLRLLRKFGSKTRSKVSVTYGGTKAVGFLGMLGLAGKQKPDKSQQTDMNWIPYADLMEILVDAEGNLPAPPSNENDILIEGALGAGSEDSMDKARLALASFCHLLSIWCHVSSRADAPGTTPKDVTLILELVVTAMGTATALVAHGCLDHVILAFANDENLTAASERREDKKAIHVVCESVFVTDLSQPAAEVAAIKFLLTTGCRSMPDDNALLRGTHLLQTIRVLYHIFLTTVTDNNKTTARAALQQLTTSVIQRMLLMPAAATAKTVSSEGGFPSPNHRDSFLVLRSLCKLSMRTLPAQNHYGVQTSGSNAMWDGSTTSDGHPLSSPKKVPSVMGDTIGTPISSGHPSPPSTVSSVVHPALESKILALELLLYMLQNTRMTSGFLQSAGPQLQYAVRNYLCVSLLKNCTSQNTAVVSLSLRLFVPIIRNFRSHLKTEIEAFVTNVFFVILDSTHSSPEHKSLVVILFEEICSDPDTLAEIFLNYDCDLSAVDLFHRIVNTLAKVARSGLQDDTKVSSMGFVAGAGAQHMEKLRTDNRALRLEAMRALRQILASLHGTITEPMEQLKEKKGGRAAPAKHEEPESGQTTPSGSPVKQNDPEDDASEPNLDPQTKAGGDTRSSLVAMYDSKKKRRKEESEAALRFNRKPTAGIKYAAECGHIDANDPEDVARYLLKNKDVFEKTQIGEYLGREPEYQGGFSLKVLHAYVNEMDFEGLLFDNAIRLYLSNFRLPGEAQKIDRIMEKFAERFTTQNPTVFPTADVAFILAFSIIMLNTDLHNPSIKEERRMTKEGFIRNNRGICDGQDLPEELLTSIFDRIHVNQISLKEDDDARAKESEGKKEAVSTSIQKALNPTVFFSSHYDEMNKNREEQFQKEREQIVRTTESMLRRKRTSMKDGGKIAGHKSAKKSAHHRAKFVKTEDSGLRDEYVAPMFDVTWGATLAAFSTAMESANGTMGALLSIATDAELESAAENAAETIETCLTGFRLAISTAGLCGNEVARDAFMLALSRFTQLGTGIMLEPRHVRCIQTLLQLGREDGELLGNTWEHVFKALSEVNRFHELFQLMARNDRVAAAAAERRRKRAEERQRKLEAREERRRLREVSSDDGSDMDSVIEDSTIQTEETFSDEDVFNDDDDFLFDDEMDKREIDEINARIVYDAVSEEYVEAIYQRSSTLSGPAIKDFIFQLCRVSRMEISGYGGHVGSSANAIDMSNSRRQSGMNGEQAHPNQPDIFNLQKIVEVTHYNMDSRPRLVFSEIWATVAAHLTSTALHSNAAVAMYAVDSFRQLSIQFLHREEGTGFEFQRKFLKPLETVMARCEHVDIRELLLNCVERIIFMFGRDDDEMSPERAPTSGRLRSGWRPVLTILGLAGHDKEESIAKHGFSLLTSQLRECLSFEDGEGGSKKPKAGALLAERFVDLVDALLMYISGPHKTMSLVSIDHLVTLSSFLADEEFSGPLLLKKRQGARQSEKGELRLWWPILLGLSRSIGNRRKEVRLKSLVTLLGVINQHFIPEADTGRDSTEAIQTLLLIFRGVLTPVLEHAEVDADAGPKPSLPDDFVRFSTKQPKPPKPNERETTWIETTFESFMDGCVTLCMRSIGIFKDDSLVEEIFAMLNTCLLSDSAVLAVRGLRRLQLFVSKDLGVSNISDDTWATFSHMLRRCLSVRGLPASLMRSTSVNGSDSASSIEGEESENVDTQAEDIAEFVAEENVLADRRYIGSNVAATIRDVMSDKVLGETMGSRWRFFLMSGLGKAVKEWERAAEVLASNQTRKSPDVGPPDYVENAIYGRKLILKLCFQLMSDRELMLANLIDNPPASSVSALKLIKEQTQSLLTVFIEKDGLVLAKEAQAWERTQLTQLKRLMNEMIALMKEQDRDVLGSMYTMTPMLSTCMQCSDERMHREMHSLIQIMIKEGPQGAAAPTPPPKKATASVTLPAGTDESQSPRKAKMVDTNGSATAQAVGVPGGAHPVDAEPTKVADV